MSPDSGPLQLNDPRSLNRYAYTLNNPLRYVDPDGKAPLPTDVVVMLANFYQMRDDLMLQWAATFRDRMSHPDQPFFPEGASSNLKQRIRENERLTSKYDRSVAIYRYQDAVEDYLAEVITEKVKAWLKDPKTTPADLEAALVTLAGEEHLAEPPSLLGWIPGIDAADSAGKHLGLSGIRNNTIYELEKMIRRAQEEQRKQDEEKRKKKEKGEACKKDKSKC